MLNIIESITPSDRKLRSKRNTLLQTAFFPNLPNSRYIELKFILAIYGGAAPVPILRVNFRVQSLASQQWIRIHISGTEARIKMRFFFQNISQSMKTSNK